MSEAPALEYLVGVRRREPEKADDHKLPGDLEVHVGDLVVVAGRDDEAIGEVRRPRRPLPDFRRDRSYPVVVRLATEAEARDWHDRRERERAAVGICQARARSRGLVIKVVDVEIHPTARRLTVFFNAEERVDFRELMRDLAREFRSRIEMRQVGARDVTRLLDGIGPCGRQLCCSSHLRKFEPISVRMAKTQDMPLTDSRLLGNCGRLKCCLLYEFSLYEELRARLPRVNTPCQASCGGGCMTGKVRSLRVLAQTVVVGFPDGSEAEVPLEQLTWEGRPHVEAQLAGSGPVGDRPGETGAPPGGPASRSEDRPGGGRPQGGPERRGAAGPREAGRRGGEPPPRGDRPSRGEAGSRRAVDPGGGAPRGGGGPRPGARPPGAEAAPAEGARARKDGRRRGQPAPPPEAPHPGPRDPGEPERA